MFIEQTENCWGYLREIVLSGYRSSADVWKGTWLANTTAGTGGLGAARVSGGMGEFAAREMLSVESLSVKAWRVKGGALAADGRLIVELPFSELAVDEDLQQEPTEPQL